MTRAKPLPLEQRRRALIEATIPLLLEHGADVSTRQIAEAAGVAEGTIFRAFGSKDDLLHAAVTDALTHDGLGEALAALPADADLATTVTAIAAALTERVTRMRTLVGLFHSRDWHAPHHTEASDPTKDSHGQARPDLTDALAAAHSEHGADHTEADTIVAPHHDPDVSGPMRCPRPDPRLIHERISNQVAQALAPHTAQLRATPQEAASVVIALTFGAQHPIAGHPSFSSPEALADLALHGLLKEA
ncbi:MAG: helix-turn-helix domain-containing protein [Propioniciclava sp.]|uniref:TetR/AcrR family transcriptional regulator n=1 Tax=Propioniciclava sp. TaxID=2038686 RepID=UPI0039E30772